MPNNRFLAVLTALMLAGAPAAYAQSYPLEQLLEVERLILAKDVEALLNYLRANPHLTAGNDAFARELRALEAELASELLDGYRFRGSNAFAVADSY